MDDGKHCEVLNKLEGPHKEDVQGKWSGYI